MQCPIDSRRSSTWRFVGRVLAVFVALQSAALAATAFYGVDLNGHPVMLSQSTAPAIVLFFTASDCPISNRYEPEMLRLEKEFAPSGVEFWWVYPNPEDTVTTIRRHEVQFPGSAHVIRDTQQTLIQSAHATVTPEAAIFVRRSGTLREVYHGRIDDRYISFGEERPQAMHHELEAAIAAVLAGRPVRQPGGPPVGCSIVPLEVVSSHR